MTRKILIGFVALAISSLAFASGDAFVKPVTPDYFNGLYVGIGAGLMHTTGTVDNDITDTITSTETGFDPWVETLPTRLSSDVGDTRFNGYAFLGFGKTFALSYARPTLYLGMELAAYYNPTKINVEASSAGMTDNDGSADPVTVGIFSTYINVKNDFSFSGAARIGYLVTPRVMIYALAGVRLAKFDYSIYHSATMSKPPVISGVSNSTLFEKSDDKTAVGFMSGVGIETMLTKNLSARAQYTYTHYGKMSFDDNNTATSTVTPSPRVVVAEAGSSAADTDVKLSQGEYALALIYHFSNIAI